MIAVDMGRARKLQFLLVVSLLLRMLVATGFAHDHLPGEKSPGEACVSCHVGAMVPFVEPAAPPAVTERVARLELPPLPAPVPSRRRAARGARAPPAA